jgi:hypothetical protein
MQAQQFVDAIKIAVVDGSIQSIKSNLSQPPGRKPEQKLVEMSAWYNKLTDEDKKMVLRIVRESIETSVFGFLCVLDGVSAIEDGEVKGKLNLFYEKHGKQQLLNDPQEEYLHDIFN